MDLYQKNPTTLRRLLNKRQNPCTQVFRAQPLNSTNQLIPEMDLLENNVSQESISNFGLNNSTVPTKPLNNLYQSQTQHISSTQSFPLNSTPKAEGDEDLEPLLQKKVKISNTVECQRKLSCEEEKDGSEHSTACETHSDFNAANEAFMLSPSMTHAASKDLPEMKLDANDDTPIQSGILHIDLNSLEDNFNREKSDDLMQKIAESFSSSKFASKEKCKLNHQCEMEVGVDLKRSCPRCTVLLDECKEFARRNEGICLNEEYEETIRYQCNKGHRWNLNYKNARRRWCAQCAKEQRAFMKKKCQVENIEREKQEEEYQRKLFEDARKKAAAESEKQAFNPGGTQGSCEQHSTMNTLEYLQKIDYEIESLAKKYTVEFMSHKAFGGDMTYQQILQVYKIMIMPEEILQTYMFNLNPDALRPEFRRMAKIIHPDKNKHPNAGNAFQKIHKVYEAALSRLEAIQQKI